MKQVEQNYRSGKLRVVDVPAPGAGSGRLLIATSVSLISSGTERQIIDLAKASLAGKAMARPDLVRQVLRNAQRNGVRATAEKVLAKLEQSIPLGYSMVGRVLEVGRGVDGFAPGNRVACAGAGLANHAEVNSVPKNLCVLVPEGVSDEQASFVTLGAIALQGVRQAQLTLGERVVVIGLGLIGLLTVQLLKANGCRVLGFDPNTERVALARDLGADIAISDGLEAAVANFTGHIGADAVIVTASSSSSDALNIAGEISRMKGRIVVVGLVGMDLNRDTFYKRELELKLSLSYGPGRHDPNYEMSGHDYPLPYVRWTEQRNMEAFLQLIAEAKVTPEKLVTHRFDIASATDAYDLMGSATPHLAMLLGYPRSLEQSSARIVAREAKPTASNVLRLGFIGLGNYAQSTLLPAVSKVKGVTLTHVATATGLSAGSAGEKYGFTTVTTDADAVINAEDVDVVFIATRHDSHADFAARALAAGKHVFVEKPLALDIDELDQVTSEARLASGQLMAGFNRRFAPMIVTTRALLDETFGPKILLYRVNAGSIPKDNWIQGSEGGGRIIGEVCHFVDTLTFLTGSQPIAVQATTLQGYRDSFSAIITFSDGSVGTIIYTSLGNSRVGKEYMEVFAADTVVQLDNFSRLTITRGGKRKVFRAAEDKGQTAMTRTFLEAVRQGCGSPIQLSELVAVTETTFAIEAALKTGGTIEFGSSI
jgi:predicted dehydrogenase/threonine dehydrogenase-like Zn-dependent dehydrogenase